MTRKGKGSDGQSGGGNDRVLEYTPDGTFNIRQTARELASWMEETGLSLLLHLPHLTVEFEAGCTPKEIIDGYFYALRRRDRVRASNCNMPIESLPV